ncbi:hypothetical protein BN7_3975 [Wickerhamomyces ciferrii]|uniref:Internalin-I n=1 Tax=Wickerhamomyces ciferrii (strain ATCC 14091 / BCRC 22168 / CBS 111 / JCM 3599 / NBRC 0793 / NRRL Y-1031 F-60-10) TaxID=1206466 RepID=K0KQI5_WICCF|nr:uncharacterized protein BN7_3975 [Wickerhamomyces ciferrii]CCH44412.1 hypothetical protein BN7_3975 [Wickerhamomyces ciferrii]
MLYNCDFPQLKNLHIAFKEDPKDRLHEPASECMLRGITAPNLKRFIFSSIDTDLVMTSIDAPSLQYFQVLANSLLIRDFFYIPVLEEFDFDIQEYFYYEIIDDVYDDGSPVLHFLQNTKVGTIKSPNFNILDGLTEMGNLEKLTLVHFPGGDAFKDIKFPNLKTLELQLSLKVSKDLPSFDAPLLESMELLLPVNTPKNIDQVVNKFHPKLRKLKLDYSRCDKDPVILNNLQLPNLIELEINGVNNTIQLKRCEFQSLKKLLINRITALGYIPKIRNTISSHFSSIERVHFGRVSRIEFKKCKFPNLEALTITNFDIISTPLTKELFPSLKEILILDGVNQTDLDFCEEFYGIIKDETYDTRKDRFEILKLSDPYLTKFA